MHHLQFIKTLAALAAAGFNPRAFLAPMALGTKVPKQAEPRPRREPEEPKDTSDR